MSTVRVPREYILVVFFGVVCLFNEKLHVYLFSSPALLQETRESLPESLCSGVDSAALGLDGLDSTSALDVCD